MRVLWFTNTPCNYNSDKGVSGYNGGGWLTSLEDELVKQDGIELGICFCQDGQTFKSERNGVVYYPVPLPQKTKKDKILDIIHHGDLKRDEILWNHYKTVFKKAIDDFKPDVIHIFGSETYMGLAALVAPCPVVLHIQGILSLYIYMFFPEGVSKKSFLFQDWNPKNIYNRFQLYTYWKRSCYREKEIMHHAKHVIGRTHWDKMASYILNSDCTYHYGGEILRAEFYEEPNRQIPDKLTIVTTSSSPLYKGFNFVLQTADILKNTMHMDFEWLVYGNVNPTFHEKFTGLKAHDLNIRLMGVASSATLRDSIQNATVYFQPSYIENSPNSVCEAQMLSVPVVATNVGGTASLINEGETGFLIPTMDPYVAAYRLAQMDKYKDLNLRIGKHAREVALKRHDKQRIVEELIATYHEIQTHA
jgi:glycosyltransferase involved in cell wall biosynthesis